MKLLMLLSTLILTVNCQGKETSKSQAARKPGPNITFLTPSETEQDGKPSVESAAITQLGATCSSVTKSTIVGFTDEKVLREDSGIDLSADGKNLFHIVDGKSSVLSKTDLQGKLLAQHNLDYEAYDIEDLATAKIDGKNLVIVGDIGDNNLRRKYLRLAVVEEKAIKGSRVPVREVFFFYPDTAHNAEAMAIHPNGDIYIFTKEDFDGETSNTQIYRLLKSDWTKNTGSKKKPLFMDHVGEFKTAEINSLTPTHFGQLVTGADISKDGKNVLLLTYENAIEFRVDLSKVKVDSDLSATDYSVLKFQRLTQQEGIAYTKDDKGFFVSTELNPELGFQSNAQAPDKTPLLQLQCQ